MAGVRRELIARAETALFLTIKIKNMTNIFFVSYTDPDTKKKVTNIHIGAKPTFIKKGLQMVTQEIKVNNVFLIINNEMYKINNND